MSLPFLDREAEREKLKRALSGASSFSVLYGRRRLGKSRLLREALANRAHVYFVGDGRDAPLSRRALARELGRVLPGFGDVEYTEWDALLAALWRAAGPELVLAIDELPELVAQSPELPSLLQKHLDRGLGPHLIVAGSSQRMMQGLVLDGSAPLYGRANAVMKVEPLGAFWLQQSLGLKSPASVVDHHALWGGVPRYWELAAGHDDLWSALTELMLDPLGVLHREPERLLLDELGSIGRSASILMLVGQGAHRLSEIAARSTLPATALTQPLARLIELGFLHRELPFGRSTRDSKRTAYKIADPFLTAWYRWVAPNRSRLGAGLLDVVLDEIKLDWPRHLGQHWEQMARAAVPRLEIAGRRWNPASRWWGPGSDRKPLELDIVSDAADGSGQMLVAEVKRTCSAKEARSALEELERKAARCPATRGRAVDCALFVLRRKGRLGDSRVLGATEVIDSAR